MKQIMTIGCILFASSSLYSMDVVVETVTKKDAPSLSSSGDSDLDSAKPSRSSSFTGSHSELVFVHEDDTDMKAHIISDLSMYKPDDLQGIVCFLKSAPWSDHIDYDAKALSCLYTPLKSHCPPPTLTAILQNLFTDEYSSDTYWSY